MDTNDWPMLTLAVTVALSVAVGAWAYVNRREPRPTLPLAHVAAAAILGLLGWEAVVYLPGAIAGYAALTAGLGDLRGLEVDQAYVVALAAFAAGIAAAVVGVLRRWVWGVVLGIGLAVSQLAMTIAAVAQTIVILGDAAVGETMYIEFVGTTIALRAVPPIAAIVLLVWPLVRGASAPTSVANTAGPGAAHPDPAG
jgi:hypothetical protein